MDDRTLWAVLLIGLAIFLFLLELVIPSAGILGLIAALSLVGGIIMLFWINTTLGLIGSLICLIAAPFFIAAMMKLWPNTPIFRALVLGGEKDEVGEEADSPEAQAAAAVKANRKKVVVEGLNIGDEGQSETSLRPVGICRLNGKRVECIADGQLISPGQKVKVTHIDGMQIKVRGM